jgi:cold shock CspA family protein
MTDRITGFVIWYDRVTGCGEIAPDDGTEPVKVNIDGVMGPEHRLAAGDRVDFMTVVRTIAVNVRRI